MLDVEHTPSALRFPGVSLIVPFVEPFHLTLAQQHIVFFQYFQYFLINVLVL